MPKWRMSVNSNSLTLLLDTTEVLLYLSSFNMAIDRDYFALVNMFVNINVLFFQ